MSEDLPQGLVELLNDLVEPGSIVALERYLKRGSYRRVSRYAISPADLLDVARFFHRDALKDLKDHPGDGRFKFKCLYNRKGMKHVRARHIDLSKSSIQVSAVCKDCKAEPGWYVGIVERYPCPTCQGGKK